jgi:hypothetical protein
VLTTNQRGAIAEAEIVSAALKLGIGVFSALHDERYDLVFDLRPKLLRVQCKTAVLNGDVVVIRCYSSRRSAGGLLKRVYTRKELTRSRHTVWTSIASSSSLSAALTAARTSSFAFVRLRATRRSE